MAPTREEAHKIFDSFIAIYEAKYPKATSCLEKDRDVRPGGLAFYDFPAEHWSHIRTTNPVGSTFAIRRGGRLRTDKTRGCVSRNTILALVFRLGLPRQVGGIRLRGFQRLGELIQGVEFSDGVAADMNEEEQLEERNLVGSAA
jgi:hypothetical protein